MRGEKENEKKLSIFTTKNTPSNNIISVKMKVKKTTLSIKLTMTEKRTLKVAMTVEI